MQRFTNSITVIVSTAAAAVQRRTVVYTAQRVVLVTLLVPCAAPRTTPLTSNKHRIGVGFSLSGTGGMINSVAVVYQPDNTGNEVQAHFLAGKNEAQFGPVDPTTITPINQSQTAGGESGPHTVVSHHPGVPAPCCAAARNLQPTPTACACMPLSSRNTHAFPSRHDRHRRSNRAWSSL